MRTSQLGGVGPEVSVLGLGLAALGRPGYLNLGHAADLSENDRRDPAALEQHAHTVLDAAWAAGITYYDAARSYGRAEAFLASWLGQHDAVVGSKWGYTYTADWRVDVDVHEVKDHSLANLDRQYAESTDLLGERLALYQVHSATEESGVLEDRAVVARLAELRQDGLIVGLSTSGPNQADTIRQAIDTRVDGARVFGAVQATWNLLEPSAGPALADAADAGLGVIVKEALANGRLAGRDPEVAAALGAEQPDTVALAAALAQPWASVVLSGAATVGQLESNVAALDVPVDVVAALPDLAEPPETYWTARKAMPWT